MAVASVEDAFVLDRLTVAYRKVLACDAISLRVPTGSICAVLGRTGAGKSSLISCLAGDKKPSAGRSVLFGLDGWKQRRKLRPILARIASDPTWTSEELLHHALAREPRGLLIDDLDVGGGSSRAVAQQKLRDAAARGVTVLLATRRAADVDGLADRIAILHKSRLLLDDSTATITARFRRIRYQNEITATRSEYGTELDAFEAVRVRARGWGVDAVVSNFSERLFDRFRALDGVAQAESSSMTLEEIFEALAPNVTAGGR